MIEATIITFLGTGGGRFATIYQKRATGGIYIQDSLNIHMDPGPGALVRMLDEGLDPRGTNGILVTHAHPDHYGDAEILLEGMTCGCTQKRGLLAGSKSVTKGEGNNGPAISNYHQSMVERVETIYPGNSFYFGDLEIHGGKTFHTDGTAVGFNLLTKNGQISYIPDTSYSDEIIEFYKGARVLIISNTRPLNQRIPFHLATEDSAHIIEQIEPEIAFLTHIGFKIATNHPAKEGEWITEKTGIETYTAEDFMKVIVSENGVLIKRKAPKVGPDNGHGDAGGNGAADSSEVAGGSGVGNGSEVGDGSGPAEGSRKSRKNGTTEESRAATGEKVELRDANGNN